VRRAAFTVIQFALQRNYSKATSSAVDAPSESGMNTKRLKDYIVNNSGVLQWPSSYTIGSGVLKMRWDYQLRWVLQWEVQQPRQQVQRMQSLKVLCREQLMLQQVYVHRSQTSPSHH
jgi:hypothetical protein